MDTGAIKIMNEKRGSLSDFTPSKNAENKKVVENSRKKKDDKKPVMLRLNVDAWKQLKMLAIDQETTSHKLLIEGLNSVFEKHGRKPIA
jgi:hypothetical protein